jgi:hypothetical protein
MSFATAIKEQTARTANGMRAFKTTLNANTDLFFKIGASRGKNIISEFTRAYQENPDLAMRVALWSRDVRGGAGERQLFRDIVTHLASRDPHAALALVRRAPELGRWDDVLVLAETPLSTVAFDAIAAALKAGDGLCAKWMPRKGRIAAALRAHLGMTPKQYRKTLVSLTKVVETQMCAKDWDGINFEHVPSLASARYKKAFYRNAEAAFKAYVDKLTKGEAKVNASAVYPYDVLKGLIGGHYGRREMSRTELDHITAQWNSLPNYVGDASVLPLVDVSGSMMCPAGGSRSVTCLDVSVGLGLYLADKNKGKFRDCFLTFSSTPELVNLKGNIVEKIDQMNNSGWGMSTNLHAALDKILEVATQAQVPQAEMPGMLLILSDMQFNQCVEHDDRALDMIQRKYQTAGYTMPRVVFWNLNASDNVPVRFNERGTALVSGFSPSIMKAVLADVDNFTPESIMLQAVCIERYDWQ